MVFKISYHFPRPFLRKGQSIEKARVGVENFFKSSHTQCVYVYYTLKEFPNLPIVKIQYGNSYFDGTEPPSKTAFLTKHWFRLNGGGPHN